MIDIHCHILHGVDDGAKDLEESVAMARIAYEDGIRDIIATPHFNGLFLTTADVVRRKLEELQAELERQRIAVRLHPGNEVRLENKAFIDAHRSSRSFSYLGRKETHLLVEQRWKDYDTDTPEIVERLLDAGVRPVLAHPERHFFFREQAELLPQLIELGVWTQVSADSLIGNFGPEAQQYGRWLIEAGWAHTLATDAHNVNRRPNLSAGMAVFEEIAGAEARAELENRMNSIV
ncbi:tyrosine protein phosphatase [Paenibacillus rhizovicinus]|uniref:Tyrosine-protein phosphatase n=1 Tax=Paenibacillus rhizovicinus TaxID=2704463 RepID=A0A6C0P0S1_9BACL|nr:CpsB/CapC family capsule biosynthesis tyrosine phosphatase [Paenibacillus rhizovicinus]QHW32068.1 tyrosine protein phosphatase [Paenibacillus rhizovicinus]